MSPSPVNINHMDVVEIDNNDDEGITVYVNTKLPQSRVSNSSSTARDHQQRVTTSRTTIPRRKHHVEDPISKRSVPSFPQHLPEDKKESYVTFQSVVKESQRQESAISELQRRCEAFATLSGSELHILDGVEDKELQRLALKFTTERVSSGQSGPENQTVEMLHGHWRKVEHFMIKLEEVGPLLHDYQRLIKQRHLAFPVQIYLLKIWIKLESFAHNFAKITYNVDEYIVV